MAVFLFFWLLVVDLAMALAAEGFLCAGQVADARPSAPAAVAAVPAAGTPAVPAPAAKPAQTRTTGTRQALVLFARLRGQGWTVVPAWAGDLLNPGLPGSFSHFYDTMSFGELQVRGQVAPQVYASAHEAGFYLAADDTASGRYDQFVREILQQADQDLDFAQFDSDGPDGVPNSGDDDGVVDAVFLLLEMVPRRFLLGPATGIGELWQSQTEVVTADHGATGRFIRVSRTQGTVQQGRSFSEAVGAMCHEYGHVLSLPDLFDADFVQDGKEDPAQDSAGAGAWCLMAWGALGWSGRDGPNSFCAWSRARLGWSEVEEPERPAQEFHLHEVGTGGAVLRIPLVPREYFLLELRRRSSNYYDRNIPAEGVLIWHVREGELRYYVGAPPPEADSLARTRADLECADGLWLDAGYPQGMRPDPLHGADNLDFWAHDGKYTAQHRGNLGDATDPFDGVRYTSFTPETNPAALSLDGRLQVRVEELRVQGDSALVRVQAPSPEIALLRLAVQGEDRDSLAVVGETLVLDFDLVHHSGIVARDVRLRLTSDDPAVELLVLEGVLGTLSAGGTAALRGKQQLRWRFRDAFTGTHWANLAIEVYAGEQLLSVHPLSMVGISPRQQVLGVVVHDSLGNGDGQAQPGETIRLEVQLGVTDQQLLQRAVRFTLRSLEEGVTPRWGPAVPREGIDQGMPDFLLGAQLQPGSLLRFELEGRTKFGVWRDTLTVPLAAGEDHTPPQVGPLHALRSSDGLRLFITGAEIQEGSPIASATGVVYRAADTTEVARVPLAPLGLGDASLRYAGLWTAPPPGEYLLRAVVTDAAGNQGQGPLGPYSETASGPAWAAGVDGWQPVALPAAPWRSVLSDPVWTPADPQVAYLRSEHWLWQSRDGGQSWGPVASVRSLGADFTAWMPGYSSSTSLTNMGVLVDAADPLTIYSWVHRAGGSANRRDVQWLRSGDGGQSWHELGQGLELLQSDPRQPYKLYGVREGLLVISEDGGVTWRETQGALGSGLSNEWSLWVHPADPQRLYASAGHTTHHSEDGGWTWRQAPWSRPFQDLAGDPQLGSGLYAAGHDSVFYSADRGENWQLVRDLSVYNRLARLAVHPRLPERLLAWSNVHLWRSADRGVSWEQQGMPYPTQFVSPVYRLVLDPEDPDHVLMATVHGTEYGPTGKLLQSRDNARTWEAVSFPVVPMPIISLVFDQAGRLYAGSGAGHALEFGAPRLYVRTSHREWSVVDGRFQASGYGSGPHALLEMEVDQRDPQVILAHGDMDFLRTSDGGKTWKVIQLSKDPMANRTLTYQSTLVADPRQPGCYYLVGQRLFRSVDAGETWEQLWEGLRAELCTGLVFDPGDPARWCTAAGDRFYWCDQEWCMGNNGQLWCSQDQAATWAPAGQVGTGTGVRLLTAHPQAPERWYAATRKGLYLSTNGGRTWSQLLALELSSVTQVRLRFTPDEVDRLYLVAGHQLLESRDGGKSWQEISAGLTQFPWFNDVAVDPLEPATLYAATPWGLYLLNRERATAVTAAPTLPVVSALLSNYPNPFNGTTAIGYRLGTAGRVELTLYNTAGQRVRSLVRDVQAAGSHQVVWDGRDDQGRDVGSGVYLCRLQAGAFQQTRRLVLLK